MNAAGLQPIKESCKSIMRKKQLRMVLQENARVAQDF